MQQIKIKNVNIEDYKLSRTPGTVSQDPIMAAISCNNVTQETNFAMNFTTIFEGFKNEIMEKNV